VALDRQPVLTGELLLLRPLRRDDFEALYRIASDPAVWEQHPAKDRTQEPVFRAWFEQALACRGALVAVDRADGSVVGTSRYVLRGEDEVEIGWTFLARARWGGVWNGEMKRLMLEHAFASVSTVVFTVHAGNVRSQRAVERLGAVRVGTEDDAHGHGANIVFHLTRDMA
jgi:RimJ/RimL family protein N-acetyltransferase